MCILLALFLGLLQASEGPLRLAIQPLTPRSVGRDDAEMVADVLAAKLMASGKFRVMERSEMTRILAEQGFQKSGACEGQKCAVEVGRILGIEQMVVGAFGRLGDSWVLTVRKVDVETGEVVGQSIRQFEGPLKDVPEGLVSGVAADLAGEEAVPTARVQDKPVVPRVAPGKVVIEEKAAVKVRVRIRADSAASATWIWLEEGQSKRKLGEVPLDTVLDLRHKVFLSAAEPGLSNNTQQYWLVGPEDGQDTAWKSVARKHVATDTGISGIGSRTRSKNRGDIPDWKLYGQERHDAVTRRETAGTLVGLGGAVFATSLLVGVVAYAIGSDTTSTGEYSNSIETRRSMGKTMLVSAGTGLLGLVLVLVGIDLDSKPAHAAVRKDRPVLALTEGLGAGGQARGAELSFAF